MTKQQQALRIAGKFLWLQSMGIAVSHEDCKRIADLCFITLPMKYRLTKDEIEGWQTVQRHIRVYDPHSLSR